MKFFTTIFFLSFMSVGFGHIAKAAEENPSGNRKGLRNALGGLFTAWKQRQALEEYHNLGEDGYRNC